MTVNPKAAAWDNLPKLFTGGYLRWTVEELLVFAGAKAAGVRVVAGIERELAARSIGHFPSKLPRDRNARVLLYTHDQPGLGAVLHLVRQLAEEQATADTTTNDQILMLSTLLDGYQRASERAPQDAAPA
ncbi:hypothetical protein [Streptomyces sp. NPDC050121]|uniref:hypothetical protein n=1 Tax=Streptomyces sp. NPDC050121 TaxID=3365601 RepID=UPI0037A21A56